MPNKELPARPNLEQYKKRAKDLVQDCAKAAPDALTRIRLHHPRWQRAIQSGLFKLSDAQLIIAREHAFESWSKFARHVRILQRVQPVPSVEDAPRRSRFSDHIRVDGIELAAEIAMPEDATGLVLFAQASGSSRYNPRYQYVAEVLNRGGLCTILTDLLTEEEELADIETEELQFDIRLLGSRIAEITDWIGQQPMLSRLELGCLGSGTGAAAALFTAAQRPSAVQAVVSSAGRPDLAGPWLGKVQAPTLFIVEEKDTLTLGFNYSAMGPFPRQTVCELEVIGASRLLGEREVLDKSAVLARDWFRRYLKAGARSTV